MSLTELKQQVLTLPAEEQAELVSFLAERLCRDDAEYREDLARRIDDRNPDNWVKWSQVKKKLD
jgi:hypothetical protein